MFCHELKLLICNRIMLHNAVNRVQMHPVRTVAKLHPGNTGWPRFCPEMGNIYPLNRQSPLHFIAVTVISDHAHRADRNSHPTQMNSPVNTVSRGIPFIYIFINIHTAKPYCCNLFLSHHNVLHNPRRHRYRRPGKQKLQLPAVPSE